MDRKRKAKFDMGALASSHWPVPEWHLARIEKEMATPEPKDGMMAVVAGIPAEAAPDLGNIDWQKALAEYRGLEFPKYYLQPFHSVPGGYLSEAAATGDRQAMQAIYRDAHPRKCLGIRDELAALIPATSRLVVDLAGGTADGGAAIARRLPQARVRVIDASPFMVVVGRIQNSGPANLEIDQGFAEATGIPDDHVDAVMLTLVFHECPDHIKSEILAEAHRILRPGGTIVLSDVPQDDLDRFRGFFEPYREQWHHFEPENFLERAGFASVTKADVAERLWTRVATKTSSAPA